MRGKAASASSLAGAARAFGRHYVRYSFGLSYLVFWCSSYRWVGLSKGLVVVAVRRFVIAWVSGGDGFSSGLYMTMIHSISSSFCWDEGLSSCRHGFAGLPVPLLTIINTDQWGREVAHCYCHPDFLPFWLLWLMLPLKLLRSVDLIVVKDWLILVKVGGVEGWGSHFDSGCCSIEVWLWWLWLCKYRTILTRKWLVKVGGVKHLEHVEGLL